MGADIKRKKPDLNLKKVILIVCEGEKTEINYFKTLKEFLGLTSVHIKSSPHPSPTKIIKYAIQQAKEINEYDEIYCVFDRDTHSDFDIALKLVDKNHLKAIVSDPCFEFWILLHFVKITPNVSASESPCKALQAHKAFIDNLPNYSKDYDFTSIIVNHLDAAIINAKEINTINLQTRQTPYTQVVEIIEKLQDLSKKQ